MTEPVPTCHLVVERGPEVGRRLTVPTMGARVGRSSSNDLVLNDPSLSRFHCRLGFDEGGNLCLSDLGSTNETLLNDQPIQESALAVGDRIEIGETVMRVVRVTATPATGTPTDADGPLAGEVDLGLARPRAPGRTRRGAPRPPGWRVVLAAFVILVLAGLAGWWFKRPPPVAPPVVPGVYSLYYEKEEADHRNIFRYELRLADRRLHVRLDDLADGRQVDREKDVDPSLVRELMRDLERGGFFALQPEYSGAAPGVWDSKTIQLTVGARTHQVRVRNTLEPDGFAPLRERIEEFARNELGLAALALPPERLLAMAEDAVLLGRKLYDEREVRFGNLFAAQQAFEEAQWYLETIEPKPEIFAVAVRGAAEVRERLRVQVDERLFAADRAIRLRDWGTAARELRLILELVPDRQDERHRNAHTRLLDVERRTQR